MRNEELLKALEQVRANVGMPMTEMMVRCDEAAITEAIAALKQPRLPDGWAVGREFDGMLYVDHGGYRAPIREATKYPAFELFSAFLPSPAKAGDSIQSDPHVTVTGQEGVKPSHDTRAITSNWWRCERCHKTGHPEIFADQCQPTPAPICTVDHGPPGTQFVCSICGSGSVGGSPPPAPEKRQTYLQWAQDTIESRGDGPLDTDDLINLCDKLDEDRKARGE